MTESSRLIDVAALDPMPFAYGGDFITGCLDGVVAVLGRLSADDPLTPVKARMTGDIGDARSTDI